MSQIDNKCSECGKYLLDPCDNCKHNLLGGDMYPCCECVHNPNLEDHSENINGE
jgi:hypothetical protein